MSEQFTPLYINSNTIRLGLYIISATIFLTLLLRILFGVESIGSLVLVFAFVSVSSTLICYFSWGENWKTQTILYSKINNPLQTVELQMRAEKCTSGYSSRIVHREKIAPFVDYVTEIDTAKVDTQRWKYIDRKVNHLKIQNFE